MKKIINEVQGLAKGLKLLTQKIDKIQKELKKLEKGPAAAKPKAKVVKEAAAKKPVVKKAVVKKGKPSASDVVFDIISKSRNKKGVNASVIQAKTGFNNQKVRDNLYKLKKWQKIKSTVKGFYVKA